MFGALLLFEDEFIHVVSISFTGLILTELIMVALTIRTWHWLMVIAEFISLAIYILSLIILKDIFGKFFFFLYFNQMLSKSPDLLDLVKILCFPKKCRVGNDTFGDPFIPKVFQN